MPVASEALKTNGHHQELDTASGASRLGRQDMPSDGQDKPVTHKEIIGWFGYMRPAVAALVVAAGIGGYIIHGLFAGGWINKPVQENHLNEIVAAQDKVNTVFFTRFDAMAGSIVTTQNQLSGVLAVVQSQGQSLARIEGYMVRSQENLVPAPAMQPPRAHPRPRSQSMNGKPTQQSSLIDRLLR